MKIFKRYCAIIVLVVPLLLAACADNDVYNPDKVRPVPPPLRILWERTL